MAAMRLRVPADVGVSHSLEFVHRECGANRTRLLEVGCGDGALAAALCRRGFDVTAIDRDSRSVARARRRAVGAVRADFMGWTSGEPFDAILFSRSLHHVRSPSRAVRRAASLLALDGRILVEDFAPESVDRATADWLYASGAVLRAAGLLVGGPGRRASRRGSLARWRREHAGIARSTVLGRALGAHCRLREEAVPYLYRYFLAHLEPSARGVAITLALFRAEDALVRSGAIRAVGRRWVATPLVDRPGAR